MFETADYQSRFGGIARLYGRDSLKRFSASHVAVVGIGGVGAWIAEALARSGIGAITLMDLDDICVTNTNRQIHALATTIGQSKVETMAARLRHINPALKVGEVKAFYGESKEDELFGSPFDVLADAIDSVRQKAHLLAAAKRRERLVVSVGGAAGRIDPCKIKVSDLSRTEGDRLLALVRKQLRAEYGFPRAGRGRFQIPCVYSDEVPRFPSADGSVCARPQPGLPGGMNCDTGLGSATHVTATMGLVAAGRILDILTGPVDGPGRV
jgi:tRNA A37 threonylcarbamoyladenosine dehydratase